MTQSYSQNNLSRFSLSRINYETHSWEGFRKCTCLYANFTNNEKLIISIINKLILFQMIFKKLFDLEANQKSRRLFYKIKWYLFSSEMDDPFSGFIRKSKNRKTSKSNRRYFFARKIPNFRFTSGEGNFYFLGRK